MKNGPAPALYRDTTGTMQPERRMTLMERRGPRPGQLDHERRANFRRRVDRELFDRDHKIMINDALADFAEEHDGHL